MRWMGFAVLVLVLASCPRPRPVVVAAPLAPCGDTEIEALFAPASATNDTFVVTCSVRLDAETARGRTISKMVAFTDLSSGATFDCNDVAVIAHPGNRNRSARNQSDIMLLATSDERDRWYPPHDITIRRCTIRGAASMRGMRDLVAESVRDGYVRRVREAAPTRIVLDDVTIEHCGGAACDGNATARSANALYLGHGVNGITVQHSTITGRGPGVGVYLAPESTGNVFRNNYFHFKSDNGREEIAIDGSSSNQFFNNHFATLDTGGIYLYRNCGENGFVRYTEPAHNQIINNVFYYEVYSGSNPSVWFGKRLGDWDNCDDDNNLLGDRYVDGIRNDSSHDNGSYARNNAVMQNQIFVRGVDEMILTLSDCTTCTPNFVSDNTTVSPDTVIAVGDWRTAWSNGRTPASSRRAGCFFSPGYKQLVLDGGTIDVFQVNGRPLCMPAPKSCSDGVLSDAAPRACTIHEDPFECHVESDNAGCTEPRTCSAGRAVGAVALCDLEHGTETTIPEGAPSQPRWHGITVLRASDNPAEGSCFVGASRVSTGSAPIEGIADRETVSFGCREHDANLGDCQIRGILYCR